MMNRFTKTAFACVLTAAGLTQVAGAQGRGGQPPLAIPNPMYITIPLSIDVNKPAAEVWARVGKYCDIGEWMQFQCMMISGKEGDIGSVRSIGNEIMVGKTDLSYTYTQPVREGQPYILYHGTVEARPVTATTSKIVYTLVYDGSTLADDAAREADKMQRTQMFQRAIQNMKTLAEGGTLPPPAGRGGGKGGAPKGGPPKQ